MIVPSTNLRLLKCNLEIDNFNQINFQNTTLQYNFFNSLPKITKDDFTFQRKDNVIRFPEKIDNLWDYNYVMYQNEAYSNKWFYSYITHMEYINDNMTLITIKTDVYQTWQFELIYKSSFVEREHVNDDTIGLHTIPENLESGEYVWGDYPYYADDSTWSNEYYISVGISALPDQLESEIGITHSKIYGGIYSGLWYIIFDNPAYASIFTQYMDANGLGENIINMFMIPDNLPKSDLYTLEASQAGKTYTFSFYILSATTSENVVNSFSLSTPLVLDLNNNYTPKNNKLLTYPYQYLLVTNNSGQEAIYHYENFKNTDNSKLCKFSIANVLTPSMSTKLYPNNYYLSSTNNNSQYYYGLSGSKLPICSWSSDTYTNWLTQNSVNIGVSFLESLAQVGIGAGKKGIGVYSGNPFLVASGTMDIVSGVESVTETMGSVYEHSFAPVQSKGNINCGDINYSAGIRGFTFYKMSIKNEYAKIIDDYFSAYGYQVNQFKIPNIMGRTNWNFIKTKNINIEAYIPQEDLNEIKQMFNNGVTLWHNPSTFLDYTQSNDIV